MFTEYTKEEIEMYVDSEPALPREMDHFQDSNVVIDVNPADEAKNKIEGTKPGFDMSEEGLW